ncbi:hypothetical protein B0H65DRAFT_156034 [Neurospora tetraspora]|uniref:Uncharacterized protein n=1 Tax=Neurospora tetraspora TaxID=94610 RepID=A0AAE0JID9_9PEZI|nr:hypothetical protein B0H65DRAFT_156034 [Neurospora tetraspora]
MISFTIIIIIIIIIIMGHCVALMHWHSVSSQCFLFHMVTLSIMHEGRCEEMPANHLTSGFYNEMGDGWDL